MPYAWTHILYGHTVIKKPIQQVKLFQFACQGPDFLFFHRFWFRRKLNPVVELGDRFHNQSCGPALLHMVDQAKKRPELREYVLGFVTHHLLDRTIHPYIHYRAGYEKYKHQKLEVILDTILLKEQKGIETWKTPLAPEIDVGKELPQPIMDLLFQTAKTFYPDMMKSIEAKHFHQAYRDQKRAFSLFYDPTGIKLMLTLGKIKPFRHTPYFPQQDYLNLHRKKWHHPAIADEAHEESFWDLWEQAIQQGEEILPLIEEYWENGESRSILEQKIGNFSYDTGKDCALSLINQFADPII